jgi:hypothetical protein
MGHVYNTQLCQSALDAKAVLTLNKIYIETNFL